MVIACYSHPAQVKKLETWKTFLFFAGLLVSQSLTEMHSKMPNELVSNI